MLSLGAKSFFAAGLQRRCFVLAEGAAFVRALNVWEPFDELAVKELSRVPFAEPALGVHRDAPVSFHVGQSFDQPRSGMVSSCQFAGKTAPRLVPTMASPWRFVPKVRTSTTAGPNLRQPKLTPAAASTEEGFFTNSRRMR